MDEYELPIHFMINIKGKERCACGRTNVFDETLMTKNTNNVTCYSCNQFIKRERKRIKDLNRMREKMGWELLESI